MRAARRRPRTWEMKKLTRKKWKEEKRKDKEKWFL
jgi:hypothetical protein